MNRGFNPGGMMAKGGRAINSGAYQGFNWHSLVSAGITLIIFLVLLYVGYSIFKHYRDNSNPAIKILNEKLVNGEITEEEYAKKKALILKKS